MQGGGSPADARVGLAGVQSRLVAGAMYPVQFTMTRLDMWQDTTHDSPTCRSECRSFSCQLGHTCLLGGWRCKRLRESPAATHTHTLSV
jgi:hypothetical protein